MLSGTFKSASSPIIFSVQISDPDAGDTIFSKDDVIAIMFDKATNGTNDSNGSVTKSYLDSLFDYENYDGTTSTVASLGANYTGIWITPFELNIIIHDSSGGDPKIGEFRFDVQNDDGIKLLNAEQTSEALSGTSPLLSGSFAKKSGPEILTIVADDPDSSDDSYSVGDTITIEFSESTNTPFYNGTLVTFDSRLDGLSGDRYDDVAVFIENEFRTLNKTEVDELFFSTQELGDNYSGFWENAAKFVITILDDEIDIPPQIGGLQIIVRESGNIRSLDSLPSISISPPLEGSFGEFENILAMSNGGIGYTKLPSGLATSIQLPEDNSGKMTFTRLLSDGTLVPKKGIQQDVIGVSVDIEPSDGANCSSGCPVSFEFSDRDAYRMGLNPKDVQILHDLNDDGDFIDKFTDTDGNTIFEFVDTTVTQIDVNRWKATGTTFSNSKFAVGGVKALAVGSAYSSINAINESTFVSLGNPELGLGGSLHSIDMSNVTEPLVFQTDETLVFRIGMYERQGINFMQHAALYLNNAGDDLRSGDYDTSIVFDKYSEELVQITDPHGLIKHGEFKLLEKDTTLLILQFSMTFAKPMDTSNMYFLSWNEDRNPTYKTFHDILTIKPLSAEFINVEGVNEYLEPTFDENVEELLVIDDTIPYWVKTYVQWWSEGEITDEEFILGIEYMIDEQISERPDNYVDSKRLDEIPKWVRDYARWWSADKIDDEDFVNTIMHLVRTGVISR